MKCEDRVGRYEVRGQSRKICYELVAEYGSV
jgi:hypothetical protein